MTKKDYIAIASDVRRSWKMARACALGTRNKNVVLYIVNESFTLMVNDLSSTFKQDNMAFNKEKFIDACQPD